MQEWEAVAHLYAFPASDRLKLATADGSIDRVFTTPVIRYDQPLEDAMLSVVRKLKGKDSARSSTTTDKEGLKCLIKQGRLKGAFNLTTQLLTEMGHTTHAPLRRTPCPLESFDIWNCRFQLMMALEMYTEVLEEMSAFNELDAPDLFFQFRSQYKRLNYAGSMIPFQVRLIHAEILRFSSTPSRALSRLSKLRTASEEVLESMQSPDHKAVWLSRLQSVNMTKARDFRGALQVYDEVLSSCEDPLRRSQVQAMATRVSMVLGQSPLLGHAPKLGDNAQEKAIHALFSGAYQRAHDLFKEGDPVQNLNNKAVCQLYMGRVKEAVDSMVNSNVVPNTPFLLNLYTIGELVSTSSVEFRTQHFAEHCESLPDNIDPRQLRVL